MERSEDGSVLVVDDASIIRVACERALKRAGYIVETVESGEAALESMDRNPAEVILLDIRMPGISGVEVLRRVKQKWPQTEVVIMTAYADQDIAEESLNLGASEIMIKPFDNIRDVTEAVAKAMMRSRVKQCGPGVDDQILERLLKDQGVCTEEEIKEAYAHAREHEVSLREALISLGIITTEDLDWATARYLEIPYVRIQEKLMDDELLLQFPAEIARKYTCLPLWKEDETIHLVMADPFDSRAINEIEEIIQHRVKPAKGQESEIRELVARLYGSEIQGLSLEELIRLLHEGNDRDRERIMETIFSRTRIEELHEARINQVGSDLYEFHLAGLMSPRKKS
jgi:two-component system response regulator (stage 0 sporulation protein F)